MHIYLKLTNKFQIPKKKKKKKKNLSNFRMVTIMMNDYPMLKYLMIGGLGLFVITSKEQQ